MLSFDKLFVTQDGLRNAGQLTRMIDFVKKGGVFTKESIDEFCRANKGAYSAPVIQIARFPDGRLFVADGHHRMTAIWLAGRKNLKDGEYEVIDWTYDQYMEINFNQKWVTPFDPRKEVRIPDYAVFKKKVFDVLNSYSREAAEQYVLYNRTTVVKKRSADTIQDLIRIMENGVEEKVSRR